MELLTKKYVYQIVGESTVGSNECIIKSEALSLASKNRKNVTSDLSTYSSNEYIDKFEVEDMPDLRKFKFNKTAFQFGENGGNGTSGVVSTDIDGNDIAFTALANVDWVKVTKAQDNTVEFTVSNNTGNMRSAKISGTNSTGFTDTINIQQDAYTPQYSHTYTLRINGAASQPTKVVINNQEVTPVKQNDSYVCIYTYSSSNVDDAPSKVSYSIAGGLKSSEVTNVSTNVSPLSWNLDNGLTKTFAVSATETVRSYSWDYQAGVDNFISIDSEDVVEMTSSTSSRSTDLNYTVSTPNGVTVVKSGMTFTATAGSTSNTGTMTVTVNGKTYDIDITYDPAIVEKTYTYTLKASGANSTPTMTINNQSITPTYASGVYTGVYSITCPEGSQPSTVNWSISGGVPSTDWGQYYISASPSSWSVTGAGSKTFSVSISLDKTEYDWSATSGSISYNDSASTRITSSDGTWRPSSGDNLQVSVDAPSWVSASMSGSTLTASTDGSETSDKSGVITLTTAYSDGTAGSCTISVSYTAPEEEEIWSDWTYQFLYTRKTYIPSSSYGNIIYDSDGSYISGSSEITSKKTRTSNKGGSQTEEVDYTGEAWVPSTSNNSTKDIVKTGTFVLNESGKTLSWTVTQKGKPHESVTTGPYYDNFSDTSLSFPYTGGSKTITCTKYYLVDGVRSNETTESKTITCSENPMESAKSWEETFNGLTIICTQDGKPHESVTTGPFYDNYSTASVNFPYTGGSKTITCTEYYLVDNIRSNETTKSKTITCSENTSEESKSWIETFYGQPINCTQDGKPHEAVITGPYYKNFSPTSLSFPAEGGSQNVSYTKYYLKDGEEYNSTSETYTISCEENTSTISKSWSETVHGLTISCTLEGKPAATGPFYKDITPTSLIFPPEGGSQTVTGKEYYLDANMLEINERTVSKTYTCDANDTDKIKTWYVDFYGTSIECKQSAKAVEPETVNVSVSGSASMTFGASSMDAGVQDYSGYISISPSVPFDVTVTAYVTTTAQNNAGLLNNTETVTISANSSRTLFSGSFSSGLADGGTSCTVTINRISPSSKVVDNVKYVIS